MQRVGERIKKKQKKVCKSPEIERLCSGPCRDLKGVLGFFLLKRRGSIIFYFGVDLKRLKHCGGKPSPCLIVARQRGVLDKNKAMNNGLFTSCIFIEKRCCHMDCLKTNRVKCIDQSIVAMFDRNRFFTETLIFFKFFSFFFLVF